MPGAKTGEQAKVVLLGSGTPIPDPKSSGPAVAVVTNGQAYLFDAGAGVVRRAEAAAESLGIAALSAPNLTRLFFTHLHSDHTLGYPDVILTPWIVGRSQPLEVYGPKGTAAMTEHIKLAYAEDIAIRTEGLEHLTPAGLRVNVHEFSASGPVYSDANISVRAIAVPHGSWPAAFGYAIDADGRRIVISGDTGPTDVLAEACHGCDVLVHEVYSAERLYARFGPGARQYHATFHTSTKELAEIASKAKPKLLVLYHQLYFASPDAVDLEKEIRQDYSGAVVNGRDLSVY
jgi:ribonuclease BN (tRNA processing enzyme)